MVRRYIKRSVEAVLKKGASEFPAVVLTGPRQSGKTTLLMHLFGKSHRYVSLDPPDVRAAAMEDPRGFLEMYPPPVIFDEVHYAPDLLPYMKERIDARRDRPRPNLPTGSPKTLAGRKGRPWPFSRGNRAIRPDRKGFAHMGRSGPTSCAGAIRSWSPIPDAT